jgi:chaperone modulatory protein CbpM
MSEANPLSVEAPVVEEAIHLTLTELCQACSVPEEQIVVWVREGVIEPRGEQPQDWRFTGPSLRRVRVAWRLTRDLELNPAGVSLALDLLDEIASLQALLRRSQ